MPIGVNQLDHFFDRIAELGIYFGFVIPVNSAEHYFGTASDETLILVAPLYDFGVTTGLCFDFFACHITIAVHLRFSMLCARRAPDNVWHHLPSLR